MPDGHEDANPYKVQEDTREELIVDRDELIQIVLRRQRNSSKALAFFVHGGPGSGRTSFLKKLRSEMLRQNNAESEDEFRDLILPLIVGVRVHAVSSTTEFFMACITAIANAQMDNDLWNNINLGLTINFDNEWLAKFDLDANGRTGPLEAYTDAMKKFLRANPQIKPVFLIDEFDWMLRMNDDDFKNFLENLRNMIVTERSIVQFMCGFIFAGSSTVKLKASKGGSPLFFELKNLRLDVLSKANTLDLINQLQKGTLYEKILTKGFSELIWDASGGHPAITKRILFAIHEEYSIAKELDVPWSLGRIERYLLSCRDLFEKWFHHLQPVDQDIYQFLIRSKGPEKETDQTIIQGVPRAIDTKEVDDSFDRMASIGIINESTKEDGTFSRIPAGTGFQNWFQTRTNDRFLPILTESNK